jgi:hypothetical protein
VWIPDDEEIALPAKVRGIGLFEGTGSGALGGCLSAGTEMMIHHSQNMAHDPTPGRPQINSSPCHS